jgi:hypothetical protein
MTLQARDNLSCATLTERMLVAARQAVVTCLEATAGDRAVVIYDSAGLAPPFELELVPASGGPAVRPDPLPHDAATGQPSILDGGGSRSWSAPLAKLFPSVRSGSHTLRVAYDPGAAARRDDQIGRAHV